MSSGSSTTPASTAALTRRTELQQDPRVGRAVVAVAGGGAGDERVDVRRDAGDDPRRRRDVLVHVLVGDLDRGVALVRLAAGEHLVEQHAGGVDVRAGVGPAVDDELGREVGDRADEDAAGRGVLGLGADRAGQPEVGDLDPAVGRRAGRSRASRRGGPSRDWCAAASAESTGSMSASALAGAIGASLRITSRRVWPGMYSMARKSVPSSSPWSKTETTLGCESLAAVRASRTKRAAKSSSSPMPCVHDLDRARPVQPQVGGLVDGGHAAAGDARTDAVATVEHPTDHRVGGSPVHADVLPFGPGEGKEPGSEADSRLSAERHPGRRARSAWRESRVVDARCRHVVGCRPASADRTRVARSRDRRTN